MPSERFELTTPEIVVLNRVIHALTERDDFESLIPDRADRQALQNLLCLLEREDPVAFDDDYEKHVQAARRSLLSAG